MAEAARQGVLRRKTVAGRESAPVNRRVLPAKALSSALIKAADSSMGMAVSATSCSERIAALPELLERLPENGLLAVLEGPEEGQGLMAFDSAALSAVIEKQMTGAIGKSPPQPRRVTRTDAALAADLIDATLQRFEATLAGREESRWATGFGYSSHVEDLRPLGLLLEEIDYRIFGLGLDFETGQRAGEILLALPAEGRSRPCLPPSDFEDPQTPEDPHWATVLEELVLQGEVQLEAVLHRFHLPISAISGLKPGDEIPIPVLALDDVHLAGAERIPLGRCRLGSSQGVRAVRLGADGTGVAGPALSGGLPGSAAPALAGIGGGEGALVEGFAEGMDELPALDSLSSADLPSLSMDDLPDISAEPMPMAALDLSDGLPDIG